MYVTKRNMAAAVENLTKHLEHVSDALAVSYIYFSPALSSLDSTLISYMELNGLVWKGILCLSS